MSKEELVDAYLRGQISRRVFIRKLIRLGVSMGAALTYANVLRADPVMAASGAPDFEADPIVVADNLYTPNPGLIPRGAVAWWSFRGPAPHTVTDLTGMKLFDSGVQAPGGTFEHRFIAAGTYKYGCKGLGAGASAVGTVAAHDPAMAGIITVPMKVRPTSGGPGTPFNVVWAAKAAPTGFVYDVQVRRPGQRTFEDWKVGTDSRAAGIAPKRRGDYRFRARMRKGRQASGWSRPSRIRVI